MALFRALVGAAVLLIRRSASATSSPASADGGVQAQLGKYVITGAVRGPSAFRVRVLPAGSAPFETPMVDPSVTDAASESFEGDDGPGIRTAFGSLAIAADGSFTLRGPGGKVLTRSKPLSDASELQLSTKQKALYGKGAAPPDALTLTCDGAKPLVCNRATYTPYYYSADGYGALGAVNSTQVASLPLEYKTNGAHITWAFGEALELYLFPAPTLAGGTKAYYDLIGRPAVLPRYAFGFGASRWGWEGRSYMEDVIKKFRSDEYPIDYFITDFEFFATETDYNFLPEGKWSYNDFGWNPKLFDEPQKQLAEYRRNYNMRMAGIRKPRIGNTQTLNKIRSKGWVLPNGEPGGGYPPEGHYADDRCLDFSNKDVRFWYAGHMAHYTTEGVDFWWNDEGETNYWTYHFWNIAESTAVGWKAPGKRFFSLNRAFTPGMARMGAAVWTGDVTANWEDLRGTPGMMLNWVIGGAPYVGCDIGGFNGETNGPLLTRWMQVGVFMPIMRVHSVISAKPHWPWLFGEVPARAIRLALELRYRLLPYHYSLAHKLYETNEPWIRPLAMEFPDDAKAAGIVTQWMDGDIMASPVVRQDSNIDIHLPEGLWYALGAHPKASMSVVVQGGQSFDYNASLDFIPAFVRPGTVLPLAPVVQHTEALPGGPLEVQVYAGADGAFDLVEDDGETTAYSSGKVRKTAFKWDDSARTLSWNITGDAEAAGSKAFVKVFATLFDKDSRHILESEPLELGSAGKIHFHQRDLLP